MVRAGRHAPVVAWATDALDVHGWSGGPATRPGDGGWTCRRGGGSTSTPWPRCRQVGPASEPGETLRTSFTGLLVDDHPAATSAADLPLVDQALTCALAAARRPDIGAGQATATTPIAGASAGGPRPGCTTAGGSCPSGP